MKMKNSWGWGIAIAYITFAGCMILFAIKASNQKNDLVATNYYDQAVDYQKKIDAGNNAVNADSKLCFEYSKEKSALEINTSGEIKSTSGSLAFYKPDKASRDFNLSFSTDVNGQQLIPLKNLAHGYWNVSATWTANNKPCFSKTKIFIP
jgi:nitrogen fixation protein FixH